MTKAERIMELYDGVRSTKEIASIVGCKDSYVRVVARQRKGTGQSEIDRRYWSSQAGKDTRHRQYENNKDNSRARVSAFSKIVYKTGDRVAARMAGKTAYSVALTQGKSVQEAKRLRAAAYMRSLRKTCDSDHANLAARKAGRLARRQSLKLEAA